MEASVALVLPRELIGYILDQSLDLSFLWSAARICKLWAELARERRDGLRLLTHSACTQGATKLMKFPCSMVKLNEDSLFVAEQCKVRSIKVLGLAADAMARHNHNHDTMDKIARILPPHTPLRGSDAPSGMAIDPASAMTFAFISDHGRDVIHRIPFGAPNPMAALENCGTFGGDEQLIGPGDLCIGANLLFVAEAMRISAFELQPPNNFSHRWGKRGSGPGEFRSLGGLAYSGGQLYVADVRNHRIQVFAAATGEFIRLFGGKGDRPGQFRRPASIAVVRDRLVVAELTSKRMQVLSLDGAPLQLLSSCAPGAAARLGCFCEDRERNRLYAGEAAAVAPLHCFEIRASSGSTDWAQRSQCRGTPSAPCCAAVCSCCGGLAKLRVGGLASQVARGLGWAEAWRLGGQLS